MEVDGSRTYPDFTICQFFGADADGTSPDIIRVVYEIGTTSTISEKDRVIRQLRNYLDNVTIDRFDTHTGGKCRNNEVLFCPYFEVIFKISAQRTCNLPAWYFARIFDNSPQST
jgi:hypothetical protein